MKKEDIKLIEKHLHSSLNEEEQRLLVERKKDLDFAKELVFQEDIQSASAKLGREQLKQKLQQLERRSSPRLAYRKWLAIAASVLFLMTAASFWYAQTQYSNASLFDEFYEIPNFSGSRTEEKTDAYSQASIAFYGQSYEKAIQILKQILTTEPNRNDAQLLLAHAYLKSNQSQLSLELLVNVKSKKNLPPEWEWLEVMVCLQTGEQEQLNEYLEKINSNTTHPFREEAIGLKEKLASIWRYILF